MQITKISEITKENEEIIKEFYLGLQKAESTFEPQRSVSVEQAELMLNELRETFQNDSTFEYYLAEKEGKPVGFIEFGEEENIEDLNKKYLRINSIYVATSFRKQGIATELLNFAKHRAIELGYKYLGLGVLYKNAPAIALYKKSGLTEYGIEMMQQL